MTYRFRITLSIIIAVVLIALAVLVYYVQEGEIKISGETLQRTITPAQILVSSNDITGTPGQAESFRHNLTEIFKISTGLQPEIVTPSFSPYEHAGVYLASGDVDGDGKVELITGSNSYWNGTDNYAGNTSHIRIFKQSVQGSTITWSLWKEFKGSYGATNNNQYLIPFQGTELNQHEAETGTTGTKVAAGDVDGDGLDEIITAPNIGTAHIKVFKYFSNETSGGQQGIFKSIVNTEDAKQDTLNENGVGFYAFCSYGGSTQCPGGRYPFSGGANVSVIPAKITSLGTTCQERCRSLGSASGRCSSYAISPQGYASRCNSNELASGQTSDCSVDPNGPIGSGKECCCSTTTPSGTTVAPTSAPTTTTPSTVTQQVIHLVSTGANLWINILIAIALAAGIAYFLLRKKEN